MHAINNFCTFMIFHFAIYLMEYFNVLEAMPNCCCVTGCRGSYKTGPKVHLFAFPKDNGMKKKWINAIPRQNFTPDKYHKVCELHFLPSEVIKESKIFNSVGELISYPLQRFKVTDTAIPSIFPNCPKYLSSERKEKRQDPESKREDKENLWLNQAVKLSIENHNDYINKQKIASLSDVKKAIETFGFDKMWTLLESPKSLGFAIIDYNPAPFIKLSVIVNTDLQVAAFNGSESITYLNQHVFPKQISAYNELESILDSVKQLQVDVCNSFDECNVITTILSLLKSLMHNTSSEEPNNRLFFIYSQLKLVFKRKCLLRYPPEIIVFASLLSSISASAYRFIRESSFLILPHPNTIINICNSIDISPINENKHFLRYVKSKFNSLAENEKYINLLLDEIHIRPNLDYKGGNIIGKAHDCNELASSAHVFMISSITSKFKEVAHITPVKSINAEILFNIIKSVILGLEEIGYRVVCIITDNNSINRKAVQNFASELKSSFVYPHPANKTRPLFFLIDTVHLLKSIRNNWLNQRNEGRCFFYPKFPSEINSEASASVETASFSSLIDLYNAESSNLIKYGYGLSCKALYPSNLERQNVNLALKIFNRTIAEGLKLTQLDKISQTTAEFINIICTWWEIVNVKWPKKGLRLRNKYQEPLTCRDDDVKMKFLEDFYVWLTLWEQQAKKNGNLSKETHLALTITTNGLMQLTKYCNEDLGLNYILTGKFQTDCLESRFGKYRQLSGANYNITLRQLFEAEKKLRIKSSINLFLKINSRDIRIQTLPDFEYEESPICGIDLAFETVWNDDDIAEAKEYLPVLTYIAGYCVHTIIKENKCEDCKSNLTIDSSTTLKTSNELIEGLSRGGLLCPNPIVVDLVLCNYITMNKLLLFNEEFFLNSTSQRNILLQATFIVVDINDLWELPSCENNHLNVDICKKNLWASTNILLNNYCKNKNDNINLTGKKRKLMTFNS